MAYPNNPYPASYKVYNGTTWVEYYFRTSADLVGETSPYNGDQSYARKFVTNKVYVNGVAFAFSNLPTSGATAEVTIGGANIVGGASVSSGSLTYISASDTVASALGKLDQAAKAAYDHAPSMTGYVPYTGATSDVDLGTSNALMFGEYHGIEVGEDNFYIFSGRGNISISPDDKAYYGSIDSDNEIATHGWVEGKGYALASNLGTAAAKAYTTSVTENSNDLVTSGAVYSAIAALPTPMQFKGTVGTSSGTITWDNLPTANASHNGWTYKVLQRHTSAPICEVGDTIICNGSEWVVVPSGDEPSGTVTSVAIANASNGGLSISGSPITSSGTITIGLDTAYGDTKNPYGSKTANYVLAAPNGSAGVPTFRALVAADIPSLSYIPLSGTSALSGSIIPSSHDSFNLGSATYCFEDVWTSGVRSKSNSDLYIVAGTGAQDYDVRLHAGSAGGAVTIQADNSNYSAHLQTSLLTSDQSFLFPNGSGTLALTPTVGTTAPSAPYTGAIWIDTN